MPRAKKNDSPNPNHVDDYLFVHATYLYRDRIWQLVLLNDDFDHPLKITLWSDCLLLIIRDIHALDQYWKLRPIKNCFPWFFSIITVKTSWLTSFLTVMNFLPPKKQSEVASFVSPCYQTDNFSMNHTVWCIGYGHIFLSAKKCRKNEKLPSRIIHFKCCSKSGFSSSSDWS